MAEQAGRGERIADALFGDDNVRFDARLEGEQADRDFTRAFEIANGIYISDVTDHAMRFYRQAAVFDRLGEDMPCVSMGEFEYAPIEIFGSAFPYSRLPFDHPMFWELWRYGLHEFRYGRPFVDEKEERFFPPREALRFIRRGVARFLGSRFLTATSPASYAPVPFTLHNQNPNHQIYYSSPYYFVTSSVFGGPSTPVTQHIHPGIYVFGVMGPKVHINHSPQFERTSQFDIPRVHTYGTLVTI